jgi:hypothetical protein
MERLKRCETLFPALFNCSIQAAKGGKRTAGGLGAWGMGKPWEIGLSFLTRCATSGNGGVNIGGAIA